MKRLAVLILLSFITLKGTAQLFTPTKKKLFKILSDTLVLDSLSLVPGSVNFKSFPALDSLEQPVLNYKQHALIFRGKKPDSILVAYKRFPFDFEHRYFHRNPNTLFTDLSRPNNPYTITYTNSTRQDFLLQDDGLTKNGNVSRGITFGNNQDVVVNSNLNLQVSGKLTPEIDMVLAATDNNIPFQADGTTAQLQEFDKVFIQLNNTSTRLVVGDYQLSRPQNSYFMNFYKRAQGVYLENVYTDSTLKKPLTFKTQVSGAVSRGKFARQVFFGIENNQGPYRLRGADNEPFIIVLSGTERIFIDGKLLQRGQENDYIIDYNSGELTFTARQIITKDKRIVAEFQYAERNYARSLFFFGEEMSGKRAKGFINFYSEQDNKNRPLQQTLSQPQKNILIGIGDTLQKAYYSGVEAAAYNNSDVFYRRTDSLVNGILYKSVYIYSTLEDSAKYRLKFSNVGAGNGNYNQVNTAANGRVYQWKAPVNGVLQGSFEPVIPLVTPKQTQMLTAGFSYSVSPNNTLTVEGVYTKNDVNRFSTSDKGNDEGSGVKVISRNQEILRTDTLKRETKLIYNVNYEFIQKQFTRIERFRSIEFERDWNRPLSTLLVNDQHLANAEIGLLKTGSSALTYGFNVFSEGNNYTGLKHNVVASHQQNKFTSLYSGSYLLTNDNANIQLTEFYRHKTLFTKKIEKIKLSYSDEFENNLFKHAFTKNLLPRSYQFWEWEASISNADSTRNKIKLFYKERRDKLAYGKDLKDSTYAQNIGVQASIYSIKNNPITVLVTYRKLELKNVVGTFLKPDNTLLNRLEYNPRYFKGFITMGIFYETGYGLENRKEFYYLEVAPGQGQYGWNDYNGNSIKEVNEFEVAQFSDQARFIRIYTPTNNYIKVLQNQMSVSLNLRPSAILKNPKHAGGKFANRWIIQTAMRVDNKTSDNKSLDNFNPFLDVNDTLLIASNNNLRQSVFFNQASPVFGADYTYINNQSKQLLTNGIEKRTLLSHEIKWRYNFLKAWSVNSNTIFSQKGNRSQLFSTRNYLIESYETEQRLIYQPNTYFRISGIYKYTQKQNIIEGGLQKALLRTYAVELKFNQTEKGSLTGRADFIQIHYNDDQSSPVSYEMLNALNKGDNYTWELSYQRNLSNNIQISINYNGRKTPHVNAVHLGGAQVRAYF
ncbi:MAG: hypothetical protein H0W61_06690 [Bacteroidetes bacterium]|nr:hypothetical protein [Bacteroidota bacterium]